MDRDFGHGRRRSTRRASPRRSPTPGTSTRPTTAALRHPSDGPDRAALRRPARRPSRARAAATATAGQGAPLRRRPDGGRPAGAAARRVRRRRERRHLGRRSRSRPSSAVAWTALFSTIGRMVARAVEAQLVVGRHGRVAARARSPTWPRATWRVVDLDGWDPARWPSEAAGFGLAEGPRGAVGHWLTIRDGRIADYQIVDAQHLERLAARRRAAGRGAMRAGARRDAGGRSEPAARGPAHGPLVRPAARPARCTRWMTTIARWPAARPAPRTRPAVRLAGPGAHHPLGDGRLHRRS